MMNFKILLLLLTLTLGTFLRLYQLNDIPPGLNNDEVSNGYNAYSLLMTGKDRYGEMLPLMFRSFGSYILPVYTYLTIIPVAIFGPTVFSVHLISALSSILLIFITTLIVFKIKSTNFMGKFLIILFISFSPWAVFFGRAGYEISLSLTIFVLSIFLFIKSISSPRWITMTLLVAGISGSTYYTERYLNLIFFPLLIWVYRDKFIKHKRHLLAGIMLFLISQLPQLLLVQTEAFTKRIEQVNYLSNESFVENAGNLMHIPFSKLLYILREFTSHYLEYFSPRSLFMLPDPQQARSIPNLSVFYMWMVVPLLFGLRFVLKNRKEHVLKILLLLMLTSPIPAALTEDPFYSTRVLSFLWVLTIIIAFGSNYLLELIHIRLVKVILVLILTTTSLVSLYNSYFILLKHERGDVYGYHYKELVHKLTGYPNKKVVIDPGRFIGTHVWVPFYSKMDPLKYQLQTSEKVKNNYYNDTNLDTVTKIDSFEIRPIIWEEDIYEDKILVGDELAISNEQFKEHRLSSLFQIRGLDGKIKLIAYATNPMEKCKDGWKKGLLNPKCDIYLPL